MISQLKYNWFLQSIHVNYLFQIILGNTIPKKVDTTVFFFMTSAILSFQKANTLGDLLSNPPKLKGNFIQYIREILISPLINSPDYFKTESSSQQASKQN